MTSESYVFPTLHLGVNGGIKLGIVHSAVRWHRYVRFALMPTLPVGKIVIPIQIMIPLQKVPKSKQQGRIIIFAEFRIIIFS